MPPVGAAPNTLPKVDGAMGQPNRVADMLIGRTIFLTGGTGFLGKVLLEKILRICPGVQKIMVLVRPKKGKDPAERIRQMMESPLFDRLKSEQPEVTNLVEAIEGDVSVEDLGISAYDRQRIISEVSILYHCAATIRFDVSLKQAVLLNTRGTRCMLELARQIRKLEAFVHVSTAYCHLDEKVLYEKPYPPPADPNKIIKCMELLEDSVAESMTKSILGTLPNTYAFTKALSEGLVVDAMTEIPAIILRPSIVIPVWKDPLPGWTDNLNGPMGLLIGAGKGVIRTMYCDSKGYADFVPVDVVANIILTATWNYITIKPNNPEDRIYNVTSSNEHIVSWERIIEIGKAVSKKVPFNGILWYPGGSMKKSKLLHEICVFFFHTIPAHVLDTLLVMLGYEPVLKRVHQRISKGFEVFEYYANNQWEFKNDRMLSLREKQNEREYEELLMDGKQMDMFDYFEKCTIAARLYLLKETPETLPAARRHLFVMYCVDKVTKGLFYSLLVWMFFCMAGGSTEVFEQLTRWFSLS